ncbi:protein CDC73 homolog [Mangifera indica]|uniref:protein CDC73 homolog n=1 Tax=Mangifera indica TaxID=29780 RepID=UPI001CFAA5A1|nr:protein CDC73 homolog [Mangifera indica]XP_044484118.1 protein CDC73 homolog [Mangifera indica]XP_044484119.1 protein CDC73 homolog [Mangifera indica]
MDPLSALRDFTVRGELDKVTQTENEIHFGSDYTFASWIETPFRSKQGNLYTLQTLVFFIKNYSLKHTEYIQTARAHCIPPVTFPDRKPLFEYLTGKIDSSDQIEFHLPQNPNSLDGNHGETFTDGDDIPRGNNYNYNSFTMFDDGRGFENLENIDCLALIRAAEKPLKDREQLLECKNSDFYSVLVSSTRREEERHKIELQQRKDGLVAKNRLMGVDERGLGYGADEGFETTPKPKMLQLKGGKIGEGVPIILVPSAFQTLITIYNVKEFLEDGVFIPTDVKVKNMNGVRPECVTVQKKFSRDRDQVVKAYEVRDKPSTLKAEDWDRVVAVFVLGKEWQFKDWPFKDHVEIFNKIIGFFLRFEDDSVESAKIVKQWNVKIISISKNKRHQDTAAALEVWDRLEEFVRARSHS